MTISGCSSCEAVQPARYQPAQRGTPRAPGGDSTEQGQVFRLHGRRARNPEAAQGAQPAQPTQAARPTQAAQAVQYQRSTQRSAEITVTTAEGDKVTLSLAAQSQQTQSAYRASGRDSSGQPQNIKGGSSSSQSSQSVKVGVEGNLSDKEVADIKKLIEAFGQLTQGDPSGVAQFSSLDSLSSAKFAYSSTEQSGYGAVQLYA
jgi:hypothetical protein